MAALGLVFNKSMYFFLTEKKKECERVFLNVSLILMFQDYKDKPSKHWLYFITSRIDRHTSKFWIQLLLPVCILVLDLILKFTFIEFKIQHWEMCTQKMERQKIDSLFLCPLSLLSPISREMITLFSVCLSVHPFICPSLSLSLFKCTYFEKLYKYFTTVNTTNLILLTMDTHSNNNSCQEAVICWH